MQVDLLQAIEKLTVAKNICTVRVSPPFEGLERFDYGLRAALDPVFDWEYFGNLVLHEIPARTLVLAEDIFGIHYAFFRLPDEADTVYLCGPWITGPRTEKQRQWAAANIGAEGEASIREYYNAVSLSQSNEIANALAALLRLAYPEELDCVEMREFLPLNFTPDTRFFDEPAFQQELPAAMLEQRYAAENRLLEAVSRGDTDAAVAAWQQAQRFRFEPRFPSTLRHTKNLTITINSLLRKSIEHASVHPYYIDKISTRYAIRIENMADERELGALMGDMIREYCAYVQKYSLKQYSPLVQKVINHINFNLDSQLSLKSLAGMCYISPSYLSNLFKQEIGTTLTDYINTQRIRRAAHRLCTTDNGIAMVAESVGIMDVNYFTKMFKKLMGTTPTQYRREHRER